MSGSRYSIAAAFCVAVFSPLFAVAVAAAPAPPPDAWPQILHDASHSSVSSDRQLSTANISKLGVNWMSAMRAADLGGPVSAFNTTLGIPMAFVGDERGDFIAYDEINGTTVWSTSLGFNDFIRSTPLVAPDGNVWVGTGLDPTIYKLSGSTGKILCSVKVKLRIDSSMMFATPPGGVPTVYTATVDGENIQYGQMLAIRAGDCSVEYAVTPWRNPSGPWATPAFGVDASGKGRVYIGTSNTDQTMYALDALTGKIVWYHSEFEPGDFDIGAAATVSAPGNNGFKDGVLYSHSKYGIMYAFDLTTGKLIWQYNFAKIGHLSAGGISSAALYKTMLVYGVTDGVEALDAVTGKLLWHYDKAIDVVSSPAVVGPPGKELVVVGDATGRVFALRLADGAPLYSYQTGNYITGSPAIVNGHVLIASSDAFLYDFAIGGGDVSLPKTAIASPQTGSSVPNPGATLTVTGTATDVNGGGITELQVSVQAGGPTGPWYDASSGTWVAGAYNNFVGVDHPMKKSSTWSFPFPVPPQGLTYQVTANSVDLFGQVDRIGAQSSFTVLPSGTQPHLVLSTALAPPATSFTAYGRTFGANETVVFTLQGITIGQGTTTSTGALPKVTLNVPKSVAFGPSTLTATGKTSGKSTTAPIDVTNIWAQSGYGPTHTGYEPNDLVLQQSIQATHNGYLSRAWAYMTGASVASSPVVIGGYAFVANTAGTLSAIDTVSGAPYWTYTITSGAAIHSTPGVESGIVVFGADDSTLYEVAKATGTLVGSETLDGIPTSPALVTGTVYVGTANGTVYAIDEATGTQVWSTPVGAAIHYSPAVDPVAGVVVVGDDAGHITTLKASTGAQVRQTSTGGAAVTVSPAVSSGKILIGASDGILRAFDESTSAADWTFASGAAIHALATTGDSVYIGTDGGNYIRVNQGNGQKAFSASRGSAIVGLGHSQDATVDETTQGVITFSKDNEGGNRAYQYQTGAGLTTQPAIVDGSVFVGAGDGGLYAFTNHGQAPQGAVEHRVLMQLMKDTPVPVKWPSSANARKAVRCHKPSRQGAVAVHAAWPCP